MITNVKSIFESQQSVSSKRCDGTHPLDIYLGINERGQKNLSVILNAEKIPIDSSRTISVDYYARSDTAAMLVFTLEDDALDDLFYRFCDDIIENTRSARTESGFAPFADRWETWMRFFSKSVPTLSQNEIRGLIGEVYFLRSFMLPRYGEDASLEAFIGVDKAHKDFEIESTWYEVKTIQNGSHTTKISSIEQLDSDRPGYLSVITLDTATPGLDDCITLNKLVEDLQNSLSEKNTRVFNEKMRAAGYVFDERYDEYVYLIISLDQYTVSEGFPRIEKDTLPPGIVKANYEIDLSTIADRKTIAQ